MKRDIYFAEYSFSEKVLSLIGEQTEKPFIELKGYSLKNIVTDENERYNEAKKPAGLTWTFISESETTEWTKNKGWIGFPVSQGFILVDIDDPLLFERLHSGLLAAGFRLISIKTPHGGQFLFRDINRVRTQTARTITAGGFLCDYRLAGKGYFVWPSENTEGREFIHFDTELDPMPLIFTPVRQFRIEDAEKLLPVPISKGSRDVTIFRHACRLREMNVQYRLKLTENEIKIILEQINNLFCEPPLLNQEVWQKIRSACRYEERPLQYKLLRVVGISEFLQMELPAREIMLDPWLPTQGLTMVYGPRGIGKTHFGMGVGIAVASGGEYLKWKASRPYGVLYLDGEMPASVDQERFSNIILSVDKEPALLNIVTPDLQEWGMPDLSTLQGQSALEPYLEGISLVIVDNISTLCRAGRENEAESWLPVQEWALRLRSKFISILFVHHTGKGGLQRGTSRREDVLDTVIALKKPGDYMPDEGARFEVHFDKARNLHGDILKPFEAKLMTVNGVQQWALKTLEDSLTERVAKLLNEGVPQGEIPEMLGVAKGTVSKHKRKAQEQGLLC